jgi:ATP-binding cassette subfamily F protein uup
MYMAVLLSGQQVHLAFGAASLLEAENFSIESGERVCIVGRNGAGKSSLLKLIGGDFKPDDGLIVRSDGLITARMAQELPTNPEGIVIDLLNAAAEERSEHYDMPPGPRVAQLIDKLKLPADAPLSSLSGGTQRRVLLALALAREPDLLLLDEPTNHLDVDSIEWLEGFLLRWKRALIFITHDRAFLKKLATRILELDRGSLTSWPGDYDNYLRRRAERLHAQAQANALFDKKLAQEEVWIRKGVEARRTRSAGRVKALLQLRRERSERRDLEGKVQLANQVTNTSGKLVFELDQASFGYAGKPIVDAFSTRIQRGDRIGIVGANGSGKTTLLKLLLGEIDPESGIVRQGSNLEIAYFDQARAQLDESLSAADNIADGMTTVQTAAGSKHIIGYLQDFLFSPEQARAPIHRLSGGERNRLLLAKVFAKPHNLLILDEPTNDLDVETLELLEEMLMEYPGTVLLVSHDRAFIDNVVSSTIALEGNGRVREYVGGYSDWLAQRGSAITAGDTRGSADSAAKPRIERTKRMSFKEQKELEQLPLLIEQLEAQIAATSAAQADPKFFRQTAEVVRVAQTALAAEQARLTAAYARWEALEVRGA